MIRMEFEYASEVRDCFGQPELADLRESNACLRTELANARSVMSVMYDAVQEKETLLGQAPAQPLVKWLLANGAADHVRDFLRSQAPDDKNQQIKMIHEILGSGFRESKDFVEGTTDHLD